MLEQQSSIEHAAEVSDILLVAALKHRARVIRVDPVASNSHKVVFSREGRAIASAFLPAAIGQSVVERFRLMADLEPLSNGQQNGRWKVFDGTERAQMFVSTSGRGNAARAEIWIVRGLDEQELQIGGTLSTTRVNPGDMLGPLRIGEPIGGGGMGIVYRAHHVFLDRACAVKIMRSECASDSFSMDRFYREARLAALTAHQGTVSVMDVGTLPDGRPYLVMELVEGRDLDGLMDDEGPLDPIRVTRIVREIAKALGELHAQGVCHCDVTPGNVFIRGEAYEEVVKLGDFGAAQEQADQPERRDVVYGTPYYMAPEQIRGARVDARTDLYALGVLYYEMICNRVPFDGDTPVQVARKHLDAEAPAVTSDYGPLPSTIVEVIGRMMAKVPTHRYQSAADLVRDLDRILTISKRQTTKLWRASA